MPENTETLPKGSSEAWKRAILEAAKRREIEEQAKELSERAAKLTPESEKPPEKPAD